MELTNAPELISERLLRVRFQGGTEGRQFCNHGQLQNSLQKESRGFCDSFPSGRWVAEVLSSGAESKQRADWATCSLWAYREATCRCEAAPDWRAQRVYLSKADGVKISCHKRKALQGQAPTGWGQTLTLTTKKNSLFVFWIAVFNSAELQFKCVHGHLEPKTHRISISIVLSSSKKITPNTLLIIPYRQI